MRRPEGPPPVQLPQPFAFAGFILVHLSVSVFPSFFLSFLFFFLSFLPPWSKHKVYQPHKGSLKLQSVAETERRSRASK